MKWIFIFFLISLVPKVSFSQEGENPLPYFQQLPKFDTAPHFPGDALALSKYFCDSFQYPSPEKTKFSSGNILVKFSVTVDGKVVDVQLVNGIPYEPYLAKEAVRVMYSMPNWIPAYKNGKPIEAEYNLAIPAKYKGQNKN